MASLSVGWTDAESSGELAIELGMREVEVAAAIQSLHQELIGMILVRMILVRTILVRTICRAQPEADEVELRGRGEFEARILAHPGGELLGETHMLANMVLQSFDPVIADDEPKLECAKAAPELDVPVAIINDSAGFRCPVAQVLRQDRKRSDQVLSVNDVKAVAIEVGEHPFVRVEAVAVVEFHTIVNESEFRAERGRATHGGVHVQTETVVAADAGTFT